MKNGKKVLITASIFTVAMNMNGCGVYGPPEDYEVRPLPTVAVSTPTPVITPRPMISDGWYEMAWGQYAVVRLVSIPEVEMTAEAEKEHIACSIEVLFYYDGNETDLSMVPELHIWKKDISLFSEGDVLFVQLERMKNFDGELLYLIAGVPGELIYTPFVDDKLVFTESFKQDYLYRFLYEYNALIEQYRAATEAGEDFFMEFDSEYFMEGLSVEEVAQFFTSLKKAKEDYKAYLDEVESEKNN